MNQLDRRYFLGSAGALATLSGCTTTQQPFYMPSANIRRPRKIAPSEKMNVACIGIGGKGSSDALNMKGENVVAVCDVNIGNNRVQKVLKAYPKAKRYTDYRKMLTEMDEQIDAVTVSTPDHTHFPAAMMAIKMGKHVFVQKPLTRTLWEARMLTEAARVHGVATQMGNQGHASDGIRVVNEWVNGGVIGTVREVHLWTNRPHIGWGVSCGGIRPEEAEPVPEGMDWNLWLASAPERPYHSIYEPGKWRSWYDFGTGALGDMACHFMDAAFWALDLGWPDSVDVETSCLMPETFPEWAIITYNFPAKNGRAPVKVIWYDGGMRPDRPAELEEGRKFDSKNGQLYIGDEGKIVAGGSASSPRVIPETKMQEIVKSGKLPPKSIPRSPGHVEEWVAACKGGAPAMSNFNYSGPLTEMVLLGVLAVRTGKRIVCDPVTMKVANHPELNKYIRESYRKY